MDVLLKQWLKRGPWGIKDQCHEVKEYSPPSHKRCNGETDACVEQEKRALIAEPEAGR